MVNICPKPEGSGQPLYGHPLSLRTFFVVAQESLLGADYQVAHDVVADTGEALYLTFVHGDEADDLRACARPLQDFDAFVPQARADCLV